jgi:hypothetical protein
VTAEKGLPRGLGISAAMSEMYLKYFDLDMKRIEGVYFYARFVDDIIVFCSSKDCANRVWSCAGDGLNTLGLELNKEKSYIWNPNQAGCELTYLGYTFNMHGKRLDVSIAPKKVDVIKTRLTRSFIRYAKEKNFGLLKLRMKFLTGNFTLYRSDSLAPIKAGIFFNYKMATSTSALDGLDSYYQKLLHCQNGRLGCRLGLTKSQVKALEKYSFRFGFDNHVNHHFTTDQITQIKNCWL